MFDKKILAYSCGFNHCHCIFKGCGNDLMLQMFLQYVIFMAKDTEIIQK